MRKLSPMQKEALRERVTKLVQSGMPPIIKLQIPSSIRNAEWFRDFHLEKIVRLYALPLFEMKIYSGKLPPALGLLLQFEAEGRLHGKIGLGASSGNWAKDMLLIAPMTDLEGFHIVVNSGVPKGKLDHLYAAGAMESDIIIAPKGIQATDYVYEVAARDSRYRLMDQYVEDGTISGLEPTMRHIQREMRWHHESWGYAVSFVMGTCSHCMAARKYLVDDDVKIIGVASKSEDQKIPGSRSMAEIEKLKSIGGFPHRPEWKGVLDFDPVTSVDRDETYRLNAELVQVEGRAFGPTSALNVAGTCHLLEKKAREGDLDSLMNERREIPLLDVMIDSYLAYLGDPEYLKYFQHQ